MKEVGVYWLRLVSTGKIYIGSTSDFSTRKNIHLRSLNGDYHFNELLQQDFNKNPVVDFKFFPTNSKAEAILLEQTHLDEMYSTGTLYNKSFNAIAPSLGGCDLKRNDLWKKHQSESKADKKLAISIDGVHYESISAAARVLNLNKAMISYRVKSANFQNWFLL